MTVEELFIALGFKVDNSSKAKAQSEASALKGTLTKILGAIGIGFTVTGIKNFIQETASYAAEMKATNTQFKQTFEDMAETAEASLKKVSQETGIAETRMKAAYSKMASFAKTGGMDAAEANDFTARSMEALADNAAYMDKTIEETQETFQKLLKGNFQLDDNLNFNLSEAERNEMAMSMFQKKTYNDLTENEKKELILQKLINANKQMGAEGQASREAGEYTNQVGELSDVIKQLKATVGAIFLPQVLTFTQKMASFLSKLADKLGDAEEEGTLAYKMTQKITKAVDKFFSICSKLYGMGKKVIQMLGGFENAMKVLGMAIGAVLAVMAIDKVTTFFKTFDAANLKVWALVAAFLVLALAVDDFIGFMNGKNSVIGSIIEKLGGDPDEVREGIKSFGESVSNFFSDVKEKIGEFKDSLAEAVDNLAELFGYEDSGDMLQDVFTGLIEAAKTYVGVLEQIVGLLAWITGIDDALSDEENVKTSKGTERMSDEDADAYKKAKQELQTTTDEVKKIGLQSQIDALEKKYEGSDTTTGGQKLIARGNANLMNSLDRGLNGGRNQVTDDSWATMKHDTLQAISQPLRDITFGLVDLEKWFGDASTTVSDNSDSSAQNASDAAGKVTATAEESGKAISSYIVSGEATLSQWNALADEGSAAFKNLNSLNLNDVLARNGGASITQNNNISTTFNGTTDANTKKAADKISTTTQSGLEGALGYAR